MIDLCGVVIERDEFEIAQRYRLFRPLQPSRVGTLALFEKVRGGQNFLLDDMLAGQRVTGGELRKMQEKPGTQGQRIYCSFTRVREDLFLLIAHKRDQVVYGAWSPDFGDFLNGGFGDARQHIVWLNISRAHSPPPSGSELASTMSHILTSTDYCICTTPQIFSIATAPQTLQRFWSGSLGSFRRISRTRARRPSHRLVSPGLSSVPLDRLLGRLLHTRHEPCYDSLRDLAAPSTAGIHLPDRPYDFEENALR